MKPKKVAVTYDCGADELRNLETRISIVNEPLLREYYITAWTLKPNGETTGLVHLELTPEIFDELREIFNNKKQ